MTIVASMLMVAPAFAASSGSTTTSLGQTMDVSITAPADQQHFTVGSSVTVSGQVSLTAASNQPPTNVSYIIDVSGSTTDPCKPTDPTDTRTVLTCEKQGAIALNNSIASTPNIEAQVIAFETSAATVQSFVPTSSPTITSAINSLSPLGSTNYDAALQLLVDTNKTTSVPAVPATNKKVAFFLSDGAPDQSPPAPVPGFTTGPGSPLDQAKALGIVVNTYSVGDFAIRCPEAGSPLKIISDTTGGGCTDVADPSQLAANLTNPRVEVKMNGHTAINATVTGNSWTAQLTSTNGNAVILGNNPIVATAIAPDGTRLDVNVTIIGDPLPTTTTTVQPVTVRPTFTG